MRAAGKLVTRGVLLFLSLCLSSAPTYAKQSNLLSGGPYVHRTWTTENGLPQNSVTSVLQTRDGYLWLGTLGGLARFDGTAFTIFNTVNTPGIKSDRIRALYEDAAGDLWVGTEHGGLTRYRQGVFSNFSQQDGLPSDTILSLTGDAHGAVWVGTLEGVAREQAGAFTHFGRETGLPRAAIAAIFEDSQGTLWLGVNGVGLLRYAAGKVDTFTARDGVHGDVTAIREAGDHTLWVGTIEGLVFFAGGKFSPILSQGGRVGGVVRSIAQGSQGIPWVATEHALLRFADGQFARFKTSDLPTANLLSLFIDREQNLWIGTDGGGLDRWRKSNAKSYTAADGLTDRPTMSVAQDPHGNIWVGAIGGPALFFSRKGSFSPYPHHGVPLEAPASLAFDHDGNLWLGDWRYGLICLSPGVARWNHYTVPELSRGPVRSLFVDSQNALWIGTDQSGLYRLQNGAFSHFRVSDGLLNNTVAFLTEDRHGALWIGTPSGISRWSNGHFTNYVAPGLALVRTIHQDDHDALWIGTYGNGLFRLKDKKFVRITSKEGLFDDVVSAILEDAQGNFWMSGNRGIFRASRSDLDALADGRLPAVRCVSYGVSDGMVVGETNGGGEPDAVKAQDGKLWFPMIKGAVAIDPERRNALPPPVIIEQVTLDGAKLPPGQPVRIQPGQRDLQIQYTALSFSRPEQVVFKYQMVGLDAQWVDAGTRRTAYFPVLSPGAYTFKVIADNGEGVWNERGQSLPIEVLPPFWVTWWFRTLIALGLMGLAILAYRIGAISWKRAHAAREAFSRQLLTSQELERQRIAAELHDSLGQSLLIIKNRAVLALSSLPDPELTREQLEEISAGASQAVEEVREISYNLRPFQLDRFGLSKALKALCAQASQSSGIEISAEIDPIDGLFPEESESSIYRISQELLNNIIKHSQATQASFLLRCNPQTLLLTIHDNGVGFPPLARVNEARGRREGFGLIGIAERTRMLKGTCEIESSAKDGTTITIRLPAPRPVSSSH